MNAGEINFTDRTNQRLEGDEAYCCRNGAKVADPVRHLRAFYASAKPYVRKHVGNLFTNKGAHSFGALGQDLIVMMRRCAHHIPHFQNECVTNTLMKKVAHRIDENLLWFFPSQRNVECALVFANNAIPDCALAAATGEIFVLFDVHGLQPPRHFHGIAISAAGTDNRTSRNGVPSGVGPFDLCFGHRSPRQAWFTLTPKIAKSPYQ